jgi:hypothetical protein
MLGTNKYLLCIFFLSHFSSSFIQAHHVLNDVHHPLIRSFTPNTHVDHLELNKTILRYINGDVSPNIIV